MSTKDDALIEAMARAAAGNVTKEQWDANPEEHWRLDGMLAALDVARKAILEEAAEVADEMFVGWDIDEWLHSTKKALVNKMCREIAAAIRALANKEAE